MIDAVKESKSSQFTAAHIVSDAIIHLSWITMFATFLIAVPLWFLVFK